MGGGLRAIPLALLLQMSMKVMIGTPDARRNAIVDRTGRALASVGWLGFLRARAGYWSERQAAPFIRAWHVRI